VRGWTPLRSVRRCPISRRRWITITQNCEDIDHAISIGFHWRGLDRFVTWNDPDLVRCDLIISGHERYSRGRAMTPSVNVLGRYESEGPCGPG